MIPLSLMDQHNIFQCGVLLWCAFTTANGFAQPDMVKHVV